MSGSASPQSSLDAFAAASKGTASARSARTKVKKPKSPPVLSIRLSFEERTQLEQLAGSRPLSAYVRETLFGGGVTARKNICRPKKDQEALARILGQLGASNLGLSLKTLSRAAETGSLPVAPETEIALTSACADIQSMRGALMQALGFDQ